MWAYTCSFVSCAAVGASRSSLQVLHRQHVSDEHSAAVSAALPCDNVVLGGERRVSYDQHISLRLHGVPNDGRVGHCDHNQHPGNRKDLARGRTDHSSNFHCATMIINLTRTLTFELYLRGIPKISFGRVQI